MSTVGQPLAVLTSKRRAAAVRDWPPAIARMTRIRMIPPLTWFYQVWGLRNLAALAHLGNQLLLDQHAAVGQLGDLLR